MSGSYNWTWPQASSLTAMKYQRHGYVDKKPFLPGERMCARRGLEQNLKGYRELRKEVERVRFSIEKEKVIGGPLYTPGKASFYKSVVGTRTVRSSGSVFISQPVARIGFFSAMSNVNGQCS